MSGTIYADFITARISAITVVKFPEKEMFITHEGICIFYKLFIDAYSGPHARLRQLIAEANSLSIHIIFSTIMHRIIGCRNFYLYQSICLNNDLESPQ